MRLRPALTALALAGAGCRESATGPYTPSSPPPSGLAVSLTVTPSYAALTPGPSVGTAGDSVVVAAVLSSSGCVDYAARAGRENGDVVVTIVSTPTNRPCLLGMFRSTYRAAVGQAPRGRYDVVLRQRFESSNQAPQELEVVRRAVTLR